MPHTDDSATLLDIARAAHPEIPWALMAGMSDNLIHGYDDVDLDEVWRTAEADTPALLTALEPLLPEGDDDTA